MDSLSFLVNFIIANHFQNNYCLYIVCDEKCNLSYENLPPFILATLKQNGTVYFNENLFKLKCEGIIIESAKPVTVFKQFECHLKTTLTRFNRRRYLFAPSSEMVENIDEIFSLKELKFVADLLMVTLDKTKRSGDCKFWCYTEDVYLFRTHKYVGIDGNNQSLVVDVWYSKNGSFVYGRNLYPDKLSNQEGRVLKVSTFDYLPYSYLGKSNNFFLFIGVDRRDVSSSVTGYIFKAVLEHSVHSVSVSAI